MKNKQRIANGSSEIAIGEDHARKYNMIPSVDELIDFKPPNILSDSVPSV